MRRKRRDASPASAELRRKLVLMLAKRIVGDDLDLAGMAVDEIIGAVVFAAWTGNPNAGLEAVRQSAPGSASRQAMHERFAALVADPEEYSRARREFRLHAALEQQDNLSDPKPCEVSK